MILICPICATRYQIDDPAVSDGCAVQCAACGHGWKILAQPNSDVQLGSQQMVQDAQGQDAQGQDGPPPEPPGSRRKLGRADVEAMRREAENALLRASPHYSYRHRQKTRHHNRLVLAAVMPWMLAGVVVVVCAVAGVVWRADIVRIWPQGQRVYAFVGLDASLTGFALRDLEVEHQNDPQNPAVVVRGRAVNETGSGHPPPVVDITLVDEQGHHLHTYRAHIDRRVIAPGDSGEFSLRVTEMPGDAHSVDVRFSPAGSGDGGSSEDDSAHRDDDH